MNNQPVASSSSAERPIAPKNERRLRGVALFSVLTALMLTLLLEALDQTVVGTALPKIIGALQGFQDYTWVVTAYTLGSITMIPIISKLSDQFGRKWFLITGTVIFLLGSALSGASQTIDQLIAFRALQGLGAGIGIALVFTVVGDIFTPAERAKWQAIFGVVYGFANLIGPTLGGWLTDHGPIINGLITNITRWRWVFYINVPIGFIALAALLVYLPTNISVRSSAYSGWNAVRRIDFAGAFLIAAATICLLLGLTWGSNQIYDWGSSQVISILAGSAVLYGLFFVRERFAAEPVLPLDLFRNQVFASAAILSFLQLMILVALLIYLPLFLQGVLGISATDSGAVITPMTISSVIGASLAGFLIASIKRYHVITIVGSLIMTAGVFLLATMTPSTSLFTAGVYMVIAGLGIGVYFSVLNLAAQNAIPRSRLGVGTGSVRFLGQLGGVLGVAIVGTVVNNTISSDIVKRLPAGVAKQLTPAGLQYATNPQILVNPQYHDTVVHTATSFAVKSATAHVPPGPHHAQTVAAITAQVTQQVQHLLAQVFDALRLSLAVAIQHGLITILIFCGIAIIVTLFLKDIPMVKSYNTEPAQASETTESKEDLPVNS